MSLFPGDVVVSYGQVFTSFADSPFASFSEMTVTHGGETFKVKSCDQHFYNVDRYECVVRGAFTPNAARVPTKVVVASEDSSASSPAGTHSVSLDGFGFASYDGGSGGEWQYTFYGRGSLFTPDRGSTVRIASGDMLIRQEKAFTSFADSPFANLSPLRVTYGVQRVSVAACSQHYWYAGSYYCLVKGAFTWRASSPTPTKITVNLASEAATGLAAPPSAATPVAGHRAGILPRGFHATLHLRHSHQPMPPNHNYHYSTRTSVRLPNHNYDHHHDYNYDHHYNNDYDHHYNNDYDHHYNRARNRSEP